MRSPLHTHPFKKPSTPSPSNNPPETHFPLRPYVHTLRALGTLRHSKTNNLTLFPSSPRKKREKKNRSCTYAKLFALLCSSRPVKIARGEFFFREWHFSAASAAPRGLRLFCFEGAGIGKQCGGCKYVGVRSLARE